MTYHPTFRPQNPALSGYWLGWASCTTFSGAMGVDYHTLGATKPSGGLIRNATNDFKGGTTLAQVNYATDSLYNIDFDIRYKMTWAAFAKYIESGRGALLQGWYGPIADSKFDAGGGFRGNHCIFVPPDWEVDDPLADGRRTGIYKFKGEAYPQSLLRAFAGKLNVAEKGYRALGLGYVYAAFTRDNERSYKASVSARGFWLYTVVNSVITKRAWVHTGGFSASCSPPRVYRWPRNGKSYSLVKLTSGSRTGEYIPSTFSRAST